MSIVTVQLGQCGNQIGHEVFSALCSDIRGTHGLCSKNENQSYQDSCKERFFCEEESAVPVARAVLVDMEPKVISQALSMAASSGHWRYSSHSHFCQKQGSGNNWANGYCVHGPRHKEAIMNLVQKEAERCDRLDWNSRVPHLWNSRVPRPRHKEAIMNLVQKEAERCDRLGGFFTIMSMAGGTGSGLGAFVTQCLRDAFPTSFILNHVIWPYGTGEVIVQNYNSVLTLSHLYHSSDALLVHENDVIHKICAQLMNIKQISFRDVNQVIAHQLGSVFQPTHPAGGGSGYSRNPLGDLMETLVPHPEFRMLGLRNIPQMPESSLPYSTFSWPGLLKHLRQMLIANAQMEEGIDWQVRPPQPGSSIPSTNKPLHFNTSIANLLILRGKDVHSVDVGSFQDPSLYTSWLNPQDAFNAWKTPRAFNKYEKSAALVSNSQFLLKPLDSIVGKAWNMFASKAYLHQYTKFGIQEEDFLDCFTTLEQVISSYTNL